MLVGEEGWGVVVGGEQISGQGCERHLSAPAHVSHEPSHLDQLGNVQSAQGEHRVMHLHVQIPAARHLVLLIQE